MHLPGCLKKASKECNKENRLIQLEKENKELVNRNIIFEVQPDSSTILD